MKELDLCRLSCPQPVIRCRTFVREHPGIGVSVLVDNEIACENVRRFFQQQGYGAYTQQQSPQLWKIQAVPDGSPAEAASSSRKEARGEPVEKVLVFLTTGTLGRGDDGLGAKLMKNFLDTLAEVDPLPWRVVLLNGAVKLTVPPEPALESLQRLEAAGVGVLVCGSCLNHYGLSESKSVGETSNMLDIVSGLHVAQKIIRP